MLDNIEWITILAQFTALPNTPDNPSHNQQGKGARGEGRGSAVALFFADRIARGGENNGEICEQKSAADAGKKRGPFDA